MGGNAFSKTMTKVVDPFNWSPKVSNSWFGKSMKAASKVIDPLNIMDPMTVLPTSAAMGKKPYVFDTTYGGAAQKWLGINQGSSNYSPPNFKSKKIDNSAFMAQQQQMLQNLKQNSDLDIARKQASNVKLASSNPSITPSPNEIIQMTSGPLIVPFQPEINQSSNQSTPSAYNLAQTKITDNISPSDLPMDFSYKPSNKDLKVATANTFKMPDLSNIKFGGV